SRRFTCGLRHATAASACGSKTTASASRPSITSASSACSSGCIATKTIPAPASASRSSGRRWSAWAAPWAWSQPRGPGASSGSSSNPSNREPGNPVSVTVILLVEDDPNDVLLTRRAFAKAGVGAAVSVVDDGEAAVAYLSGQGPYADRTQY